MIFKSIFYLEYVYAHMLKYQAVHLEVRGQLVELFLFYLYVSSRNQTQVASLTCMAGKVQVLNLEKWGFIVVFIFIFEIKNLMWIWLKMWNIECILLPNIIVKN